MKKDKTTMTISLQIPLTHNNKSLLILPKYLIIERKKMLEVFFSNLKQHIGN
jgi:hypothetical protein